LIHLTARVLPMSIVANDIETVAGLALPPLPSDMLGRLSLEKYHDMVRQGILTENDPFELWEGVLVQKMPKSPAHCLATELAVQALTSRLPGGWHVDGQQSLTLLGSEVEPDAMVVRGGRRDYVDRHPGGGDVALVVEVSDSSLANDRGFKKELYSRAGIPIYWIVNLGDRCVEVFSDPARREYRKREVYGEADELPFDLGGREALRISVREILP
jgi:Uma2 family endonuclease